MTIPVIIPSGLDYFTTTTGSVLKLVRCESCHAEYAYELQRSAEGKGSSFLFLDNQGAAARASSRAEANLRNKLERGVDLVPCPECGWYQDNMQRKARRLHQRWMLLTGVCLALSSIPVGLIGGLVLFGDRRHAPVIPQPVFLVFLLVLVVAGISLAIAKIILTRRYDPNCENVETRKELGRWRAIPNKELEAMVKEADRKSGRKIS